MKPYVPSEELEAYIDGLLIDVYHYKDKGFSYGFVHECTKRIMNNISFDINGVQPTTTTTTKSSKRLSPQQVSGLPKLLIREENTTALEKIAKQNKMKGRGGPRWTKIDMEKLLLMVSKYTAAKLPPNWKEISEEFDGRSEYGVYEKYVVLNGSWTTIRKRRTNSLLEK